MTQIRKILLNQKDKFIFAFLFTLFFAASFAEGSALVLDHVFASHSKSSVSALHISSLVDAPIEDFVFEEYEEEENFSFFRFLLKKFHSHFQPQTETHISNHAFEHFSLVVHLPFYDLFCNWKAFPIA